MSVSIFNTFHYDNDFSVLKFTEAKTHQSPMPRAKLDHVRRNLFGPVDRKECNRFAEEKLAKHQMSASQKWGFDFVRGCPLEETKLFLWERVPPTNEIPEMYAFSRAAHIRPIDPSDRTPSKKRRNTRRDSFLDLYDELAERLNRYVDTSKNNVLDLSFEDVDGGHTSSSSCDEDSFEEDDTNVLCDMNWMPTAPSAISAKSIQTNLESNIVHANTSGGLSSVSKHDFLKERKRLQPTLKKISPKKQRTINTCAASCSMRLIKNCSKEKVDFN